MPGQVCHLGAAKGRVADGHQRSAAGLQAPWALGNRPTGCPQFPSDSGLALGPVHIELNEYWTGCWVRKSRFKIKEKSQNIEAADKVVLIAKIVKLPRRRGNSGHEKRDSSHVEFLLFSCLVVGSTWVSWNFFVFDIFDDLCSRVCPSHSQTSYGVASRATSVTITSSSTIKSILFNSVSSFKHHLLGLAPRSYHYVSLI